METSDLLWGGLIGVGILFLFLAWDVVKARETMAFAKMMTEQEFSGPTEGTDDYSPTRD